MSIKLLNLNTKTYEEPDYGGVEEAPPVGVYSPLREKFGTVTNFDFDEATSTTSDSSIVWFHQAASEGAIDLVKFHLESLAKSYVDGSLRYQEERDKILDGFSALHIAARHNRKNVVKYLLDKGAPINQVDEEDKNTPLLLATKYNMSSSAKILIECGADPTIQNKYGTYPLHFTARRGNAEICQMILDTPGVHVNTQLDKGGGTALHSGMLGASEEVTELLIRYGADVMANNVEGEEPIHFAAAEDAGDIIVLLAKGAISRVPVEDREQKQREFVNSGTKEYDTALHIAAQSGFIETVKTLVHIGANVNQRTDTKQTPLHLAAINGQLEVVRFLVRSYAKISLKDAEQMTPLHKACQFGRIGTVKFLVEQGARLDVRDRDGFTPLMCAVWKGQNEVVSYLIDQKANIRIDDANNKCVLHLAIEEDHYDTLALLIGKGCKALVDDVDKDYKSVLHYAAEKGNESMLSLLLNNGAKIDVCDIEEKTPLHTAAEQGNISCVQCISKEAPGVINATDGKGMSPLHLAAANGHIYVCETLIELGAEISCRDEWNWTPLDYAARNGYFKTMKILLDNDAPVDACDTNNTSPLHHASQCGHTDCINMLLDNGASIALRNVDGKNCLDLAVENFQKDACVALISHARWEETVKHLDKRQPPPMKKLIQYAPEIAEVVLNNCINKKQLAIEGRAEYSTVYDFRYIDIKPEDQADAEEPYFGPSSMVKFRRDKLLSHPLTVKLINDKWARLGRWVYICSLSTYLLFVSLLTSLVIVEKAQEKDLAENLEMNITNITTTFCERGQNTQFTKIVPWLTLGVACFQIIKEFIQAIYLGRRYLKDIVNWFEFALYSSTFLFMLPFIICQVGDGDINYFGDKKLEELKWQAGAVSILFAWFNLLLYLKRFPFFGLYVVMFTEVLSTLLNVLCVFSILVVGFALSFYSLFKISAESIKKVKDAKQGSFRNVGTALVRTIVMMVGELDYRAQFTENFPDDKKPLLPYKFMSYIVFILFVITMTIVVMNLLVGLAIGDIESVRKNAYIRMLRGQVHILQVLERTYPTYILRKVYKESTEELPKKRRTKWKRFTDWLGSIDFDSLKEDQMEISGKEQLMSGEIETQRIELDKQKQKMKQLTTMIELQSETMKRIVDRIGKIPTEELKKYL